MDVGKLPACFAEARPAPGSPRPKACNRLRNQAAFRKSGSRSAKANSEPDPAQRQIPDQLRRYELRDRWCSCLKQTQRGTEYLKAKINFGKARFFEDFQPTKATPEDLENRTIRAVLRVLVWVAPAQVGLSLEVSDVMLGPKAEDDLSCPFVAA